MSPLEFLFTGLFIVLAMFGLVCLIKFLAQPVHKPSFRDPPVDMDSPEMNRVDDVGGPR
jgi:hypothetical protein